MSNIALKHNCNQVGTSPVNNNNKKTISNFLNFHFNIDALLALTYT